MLSRCPWGTIMKILIEKGDRGNLLVSQWYLNPGSLTLKMLSLCHTENSSKYSNIWPSLQGYGWQGLLGPLQGQQRNSVFSGRTAECGAACYCIRIPSQPYRPQSKLVFKFLNLHLVLKKSLNSQPPSSAILLKGLKPYGREDRWIHLCNYIANTGSCF